MKVVFTNGCFDILHVGHVRLLAYAKTYGDYLIVGLNSDASFRRHKHRDPINTEENRYEVLMALQSVDEVRIFDEDTPLETLADIRPDFLVKGCDYEPEEVVGREYAGKVLCLRVGTTVRTTSIIEKIRQETP